MDKRTGFDYEKYGLKPGVVYCGNQELNLRELGIAEVARRINATVKTYRSDKLGAVTIPERE